jgi:hypothetical protein
MEMVMDIVGWTTSILGTLYFLIRFFYFGVKNSFENEINKFRKFEYFLFVKSSDIDESHKKIRVWLNVMLRCFGVLFIIMIILMFTSVLIEGFSF